MAKSNPNSSNLLQDQQELFFLALSVAVLSTFVLKEYLALIGIYSVLATSFVQFILNSLLSIHFYLKSNPFGLFF